MSEKIPLTYSRSRSLGSILMISFLAIVMLPILIIGLVLSISTAQGTRQQVGAQLSAVTQFKHAAVQNWTKGLKVELGNLLVEETALRYTRTLLTADAASPSFQVANDRMQRRFRQALTEGQSFNQLMLLNGKGIVILADTLQPRGNNYSQQDYFIQGMAGPYIQPLQRLQTGEVIAMVAHPVTTENGEVLGVMAGRASLTTLLDTLTDGTGQGASGKSYLVLPDFSVLAPNEAASSSASVTAAQEALNSLGQGSGSYTNYAKTDVIGAYLWMPELNASLFVEQDQAEALRGTRAVLAVNISVALASLLVAFIASLQVAYGIAAPVSELANAATNFSSGDLDIPGISERDDEIGVLGRAFHRMTGQIRLLVSGLESSVSERTAELERRTALLEASTQVSQIVLTILDQDRLIKQAVELIQKHFHLYYVGLFLLNDNMEWALLKAGTGEAGKAMLARGHRLKVAGASMIGWAVANAQARIALQAGEDPIRLATAELPDTRSEAAIPLRVRGHVVGALTVQSSQPNAFDEISIALLQTLADQLAIALENARLFSESQAAMEAERKAFSGVSRSGWQEAMKNQAGITYRGTEHGSTAARPYWRPEFQQAIETGATVESEQVVDPSGLLSATNPQNRPLEHDSATPVLEQRRTITIPIKVRGTTIGLLDTYKPANARGWTQEEVSLLETVAEQLGIALDSARLYQETQNRAERERMVSEVTARMRESLDLETVLQTAVREVGQTLGLAEVSVLLSSGRERQGNGGGQPGKEELR